MKLKRFLLRYYPPGIILEYLRTNGQMETKSIDLLNLSEEYFIINKLGPMLMNWSKKSSKKNLSSTTLKKTSLKPSFTN